MVHDTPPSQDASTHQIWNFYLKEYRRYAPDMKRDGRTDIVITIKTKSELKVMVTVTRKWYATLRHPKMYPHNKFGIPTSKNVGDMHRTRSGTDGQCSQSSFGGIIVPVQCSICVWGCTCGYGLILNNERSPLCGLYNVPPTANAILRQDHGLKLKSFFRQTGEA